MSSDSALSGVLRRRGTARLVTGLAAISALGLGLLLVPGSPTAALTTTPFDCAAWITGGSTQARTIGDIKYNVTSVTHGTASVVIAATRSLVIDYVIVAPGGGGGRSGNNEGAGGGGGGGVQSNLDQGSPSITISGTNNITWGAVGAAGNAAGRDGSQGGNTTAFGVTATGGGGGAGSNSGEVGTTGGSGGGGGSRSASVATVPGRAGTSPQGQSGGDGRSSSTKAGGGGGGYSAPGGGATDSLGGTGGAGYNTTVFFGGSLLVAGGGGGSRRFDGTGGPGATTYGGGNGGTTTNGSGSVGSPGTGGGGGAGYNTRVARAGGTGVILFRSRQFCQIPDAPTASRSGSTLNVVASAYKPAPGVSAMQYSILYRVGSAVSDWKVWAKSPVGWNPGAGTDVTLSTSTCPAVGGAWTCNPTQPMQAGTSYEIGVSARSGSTGIISNSPITLVGGGTWTAGP